MSMTVDSTISYTVAQAALFLQHPPWLLNILTFLPLLYEHKGFFCFFLSVPYRLWCKRTARVCCVLFCYKDLLHCNADQLTDPSLCRFKLRKFGKQGVWLRFMEDRCQMLARYQHVQQEIRQVLPNHVRLIEHTHTRHWSNPWCSYFEIIKNTF